MNINYKKTISIVIIILLAFFGYWFYFLSKKDVNDQNNIKPQNKISNTQYDKGFVSSLLGLNSVELNVAVFQSSAFKALDYPKTPFPANYIRESGRANPFLPIGYDGQNVNKTVIPQNPINDVSTTISTTTSTTTIPKPKPKTF